MEYAKKEYVRDIQEMVTISNIHVVKSQKDGRKRLELKQYLKKL